MTKIYVTGVSGTGKSTLTKELNKHGIAAFDMDLVENLCYWKNRKTGESADYRSGIGRDWIEAHEWLCDVEKLKELLNTSDTIVILGLAANQKEYLYLFDKIILLHCNKEAFLYRLKTREGKDEFAKNPSEQEYILSWYENFEKDMISHGALPVSTEEPLSSVVGEIQSLIVNNHA